MKFAKLLQDEVVPEWRKAYINYKQGKKYLKAIEVAIENQKAAGEALNLVTDPRQPGGTTNAEAERRPSLVQLQGQVINSPTGTTPILIKSCGRVRSYDSIRGTSPEAEPRPDPTDDRASQRSVRTLQETQSTPSGDGNATHGISSERPQPPQQYGNAVQSQGPFNLGHMRRRLAKAKGSERSKRPRVTYVEGEPLDSVMDQLLEEEKTFLKFLDSQLAMVDTFYRDKEREAGTKLKILKQQLYVAEEWKRRQDEKFAKKEAEDGWYQAEWSKVRHGLGTWMGGPSTEDVTLGPAHPGSSQQCQRSGAISSAIPTDSTGADREEQTPQQRENSVSGRNQQVDSPPNDPVKWHTHLLDEEVRRQHLNHNVARARIKAALYEFYRSLEMLKNYRILNNTGFVKIMKKFDKTAGWKASKGFVAFKLRLAHFMSESALDDLFKETEDLFIEKFEGGRRRRGMAKLRIPDVSRQSHHAASARVGLYLGLAVPFLILGLQGALSPETQARIPDWSGLLQVYSGLFLTTLFACLFGVNMYVWSKARINYKFIFEFDPRDNLDYHQFFEIPALFMLFLCIAVYLDFGSQDPAPIPFAYNYPAIFMGIIVFILFCPLPIWNWSSRKWFLLSIGRLLISGYYSVEFRDFFLGDELNSLTYSIQQFEYAICAYAYKWNDLNQNCAVAQEWLTPFFASLPAWFRFLQCLRRYRDTLQWFPHLVNGGKYFCTLIQIFVYYSYRHYSGSHLKTAYITVSSITSLFTFSWDIYMDWGLLRFGKHGGGAYGHPFLRPELVYSWEWSYYVAIVLDFLGRFSWIVRVALPNANVLTLSFILALVEVLRRWMWNFFRLENEHLNNCGQFRAIKDIPLPFHIHVEGETESDMEEEEMEGLDGNNQEQGSADGPKAQDTQVAVAEGVSQDQQSLRLSLKHRRKSSRGGENVGLDSPISPVSPTRPLPRKRPSERSEEGLGRPQSNAFVDNAMVEAGFADDQRELLTSVNKFFERRDFDTKDVDNDGLFRTKSRPRSGTVGTTSDLQNGGVGSGGTLWRKNSKIGSLFNWGKDSDDDTTDDDD